MNQWKKALDHMAGTAIFVIEQNTHKILYYNKRVEELNPNLTCGEICSEVWNCDCTNCPLKGMGDQESNTVVNYQTPFGEVVDMTATKVVWEDIPAYIISVSNHVLTEREQELELGRAQMQVAVSQLYTMVISVNLTRNTYFMVEYDDFDCQCVPVSGAFDELLERGVQSIHPDYREAFVENFNRESLLKLYESGETSRYMEHQQMGDDGRYHWTDTHVIRIENPYNDDVLQVFLNRNIDRDKQMEAQMREALSKEEEVSKRFAISILNMYDNIYEAELSSGQIYSFQYCDTGLARVLMDQTYEEVVGAVEEELVSKNCRKNYHDSMQAELLKKRLLEEDRQVYVEYQRKTPGGSCRWYSNQMLLLSANPNDFRILIFTRDIDDIRRKDEQKKQELQKALDAARKANHAKSDFVSRMSHDIRTPINAIMGMSAIAASNLEDPERMQECLEKIGVSTRFLLSLINDILDMSRIESGKLTIVEKEFHLNDVIQGIVTMITPQVTEKHQKFILSVDEEAAAGYFGDELRINQVLMNLLSNAIKYTGEGGSITLEISRKEIREQQAVLQLKVKDTGIGMSEEFQKVLFEPFEQENATEGRVFEGSGLGLPITRNLVELMKGTLTFTSKLDEGSCFIVELPLRLAEQCKEQQQPKQSRELTEDFNGERVLVVEDNEINLEIVQTLLEAQNLVVESAENGLVAVEKFQASEPDWYQLVLMDIRMPVMDGITATKKIRALEREDAGRVPIVALTANAFQEDTKDAEGIGMTAYLTKPIEMEVLHQKLKEFI